MQTGSAEVHQTYNFFKYSHIYATVRVLRYLAKCPVTFCINMQTAMNVLIEL